LSIPIPIVEKDYYVTMILKQLSLNVKNCVFKGGTNTDFLKMPSFQL